MLVSVLVDVPSYRVSMALGHILMIFWHKFQSNSSLKYLENILCIIDYCNGIVHIILYYIIYNWWLFTCWGLVDFVWAVVYTAGIYTDAQIPKCIIHHLTNCIKSNLAQNIINICKNENTQTLNRNRSYFLEMHHHHHHDHYHEINAINLISFLETIQP